MDLLCLLCGRKADNKEDLADALTDVLCLLFRKAKAETVKFLFFFFSSLFKMSKQGVFFSSSSLKDLEKVLVNILLGLFFYFLNC